MNNIRHYLQEIFSDGSLKVALSLNATVISLIEGFYGCLVWGFLGLFTIDLITGILKSKKKRIKITSKRLRDSVNKLLAYMLLITALIITSRFEATFVPVVTFSYYYFMFTELKSIKENVDAIGIKTPSFLKDSIESRQKDKDEGGIM